MRTAEIIREEHRWIRLLLDCLERVVEGARAEGRIDPEASAELLCLLDEFADGEHQRKEEEVLLPLLLTRTSAEDEEALAALSEEHYQERELLGVMRADLAGALHGEALRLGDFTRESAVYVDLQRKHVQREDAVLLPLVERTLTPEDDARAVAGFQHVEVTGINMAGVHERVTALCHRLGILGAD
jgi:hemerythrin-like domain-containing protein